MSKNIDLNLLPVARQAGRDYPEMMRLHSAEPPRRPARGRTSDHLALYMVMVGNAMLSPGKQGQALEYLAEKFYKTPGSSTAAMKAVAEELNTLLNKRNMRIASSGRQGTALLTQIVLRGDQVYLAISGLMHAYLITSDSVEHFFNSEMEGKYLGQSRVTPLWFFQKEMSPSDTLILTAHAVQEWDEKNLSGLFGQGPETLRRRLFNQMDFDINAVVIQARSGKGNIFIPRFSYQEEESVEDVLPRADIPKEQQVVESVSQLRPSDQSNPVEAEPPAVERDIWYDEKDKPRSIPAIETRDLQPMENQTPALAQSEILSNRPSSFSKALQFAVPMKEAFSAFWSAFVNILARASNATGKLLLRIMPEEAFKGLSSSVMAVIAIAIPVVVVAVASQVYFSLGRAAQNQSVYAQALRMAEQADKQTDLLAKRAGWEAALEVLESADDSPEILSLEEQAKKALDDLELVQRVNYQPALAQSLPVEINVVRMAISGDDLYMLDGNSGNVIRATESSRGYVIDPAFQCGPTVQGVPVSGPIIDMMPWPAGFKPEAALITADAHWNLLLCKKNEEPTKVKLTAPSNATLGNLIGFEMHMDDLYVFDPTSNAVWIYWNNQIIDQPDEEPYLYFDNEIPYLQDVIDLSVSGDEIYLLHSDGHLTVCVYSGLPEVPTRCSDPSYIDFRPGSENTPLQPRLPFTQILISSPPNPSIYLFEPTQQAIFQFSLRSLGFQRQFLPGAGASIGNASAYAVDNLQRLLFLAFGNAVFSAPIP